MAANIVSRFQTHWKNQYKGDFEIQFSERLLCLLYYHTDVGLIPRSKGRPDISPMSSQCSKFNWKKAIEGCYWCSDKTTSYQAICCSSGCLVLFHEWCVCKVNKTRFSICKYPGCESEQITMPTECCKAHEAEYSNRFGIIQSNKNLQDPKWYFVKPEDHRISSKNDSISMKNEMDFAITDVTMTGAVSSLFILSKSLYEELIYRTDVGPIPRDSNREEHLSSEFSDSPNWRVAIEGCYWCGRPTRTNQYTYVCNKKCYSLFHEWCRRKVYEFCGDSIDKYFSQLLETIRNRQTNLISKLNDSLSRYKQERINLRNKVRELEGKERYYTESTPSKYSIIVQRSDAELLVQLRRDREYHETMRVEFEWSRKYAREASKIGYLKLISTLDTLDSNIPFAPETPVSEEDDPDSVTFKAKRTRIFDFDTNSLSPLSNKICRLKPKLKK